jgi:hypothetical protein
MIDAQHVRSPLRILLSVFLVTARKSLRFVASLHALRPRPARPAGALPNLGR